MKEKAHEIDTDLGKIQAIIDKTGDELSHTDENRSVLIKLAAFNIGSIRQRYQDWAINKLTKLIVTHPQADAELTTQCYNHE